MNWRNKQASKLIIVTQTGVDKLFQKVYKVTMRSKITLVKETAWINALHPSLDSFLEETINQPQPAISAGF
jgi:hypothetical protein